MGIKPDNKPFPYPEALKSAGIMPIHNLSFTGNSESSWNRLWIVVENIDSLVIKSGDHELEGERFAFIKDVTMGIRARRMVKDNQGILKDADV